VNAGEKYYPFRTYNLTGNSTMFITIEGTRSNYQDNTTIFVNIDGNIKPIKVGGCKDWEKFRICYSKSITDMNNSIGSYDRYFGIIPEIFITIENLKKEVSISISTDKSFYFSGDEATINFNIENKGVKLTKGKLFIVFPKPVHIIDKKKFLEKSYDYLYYNIGTLYEDHDKNASIKLLIENDNISIYYWTEFSEYKNKKKEKAIEVKKPLDISLEISNTKAEYDGWFSGKYKIKNNGVPVLMKKFNIETDLEFNESDINEFVELGIFNKSIEHSFKILAKDKGKHYVKLEYEYNYQKDYFKTIIIPLNVSVDLPYINLSINSTNLSAESTYHIDAKMSGFKDYVNKVLCYVNNDIVGRYELDGFGMGKYINLKIPKVIKKTDTTLNISCDFYMKYGQIYTIYNTTNVTINPIEYIDIDKNIVKDKIKEENKKTIGKPEVVVDKENTKEESFIDKILKFFGFI